MMKIKNFFRIIPNIFFCKKYPFWKMTDSWYMYNTSTTDKRIGSKKLSAVYKYTWYDEIPSGWKKAFGKQLSEEIKKQGLKIIKESKKQGKKVSWSDLISFQQIKEKWGWLCLYASAEESIRDILDKYEFLSTGYCIRCGKPSRYKTKGWIEYYCKDCFNKYLNKIPEKQRVEELNTCRLTEKDIPHYECYKGDKKEEIDLKEKYGIDFTKLYGLDD